MTDSQTTGGEEHRDHHEVRIFIDNKAYDAPRRRMTGGEILDLAGDKAGRVLWEEFHGGKERRIEDDETVELHEDEQFFTTPRHINPGRSPRP